MFTNSIFQEEAEKHKCCNNSGFTLVEILFSTFIIVIGMFGVMSLIIIVSNGSFLSKRTTQAATLAQSEIEELKNLDYDAIVSGTSTVYEDYTNYYLDVVVQDDTPAPSTKTIKVGVYWEPSATSSAHNVELYTIIAK